MQVTGQVTPKGTLIVPITSFPLVPNLYRCWYYYTLDIKRKDKKMVHFLIIFLILHELFCPISQNEPDQNVVPMV